MNTKSLIVLCPHCSATFSVPRGKPPARKPAPVFGRTRRVVACGRSLNYPRANRAPSPPRERRPVPPRRGDGWFRPFSGLLRACDSALTAGSATRLRCHLCSAVRFCRSLVRRGVPALSTSPSTKTVDAFKDLTSQQVFCDPVRRHFPCVAHLSVSVHEAASSLQFGVTTTLGSNSVA